VLSVVILFLFYVAQYIVIFSPTRPGGGGDDPPAGRRSDGGAMAFGPRLAICRPSWLCRDIGDGGHDPALAERAGGAGQIASRLFGMAWNIATFPSSRSWSWRALAGGGGEAQRRAAEKDVGRADRGQPQHWPGLWAADLFDYPAGYRRCGAGDQHRVGAVAIAPVAIAVVLVLGLSLISSALSGIYSAAVYNYAVTGEPGTYFEQGLVEEAFRPKK